MLLNIKTEALKVLCYNGLEIKTEKEKINLIKIYFQATVRNYVENRPRYAGEDFNVTLFNVTLFNVTRNNITLLILNVT